MNLTMSDIDRIAERVARSRAYGYTHDQAFLVLLYGAGVGLSPGAALDLIVLDRGRPSLRPQGALALALRSGALASIDLTRLVDETGALVGWRCAVERRDGFRFSAAFTLDDAARAGLLSNPAWRAYPDNMLRWRAIGHALDIACPDVIAGLTSALKSDAPLFAADDERDAAVLADPLAEATLRFGEERVARALLEHDDVGAAVAALHKAEEEEGRK